MNKFKPSFSFTHMLLDRASSQRKGAEWIEKQLADEHCKIIPIWKGQFIFVKSALFIFDVKNKSKELSKAITVLLADNKVIFLGLDNQSPVFVVDFSHIEQEELTLFCKSPVKLLDLRSALPLIDTNQASMLGYASSLSYWHRANKFCGFCGNKTISLNGGHSLQCSDEVCNKETFPRTDPVVIMLVEYKPKNGPTQCLLAEHHRSADKLVSTLAGFIDPAETLEQAVIREVKEEAGVNVSNVQYVTSQPWPFPSSLMLGFYATADDPSINIDDEEIRDAKWFTADEVRTFGNWGDEGDNYKLPRKESIARYLIDCWLENN